MSEDTPTRLSHDQQQLLLLVARDALAAHLTGDPSPALTTTDPALTRPAAAFVTLRRRGSLRGCTGCTEARTPLVETVRKFAVSAGMHDPRFPPMTLAELADTSVEISVLSPLSQVGSADEIIVGEHGVMVQQGARRGLFLPQVATENGLDRDEFLTLLCSHKAGLAADAWRGSADLYVFTVEKFGDDARDQ